MYPLPAREVHITRECYMLLLRNNPQTCSFTAVYILSIWAVIVVRHETTYCGFAKCIRFKKPMISTTVIEHSSLAVNLANFSVWVAATVYAKSVNNGCAFNSMWLYNSYLDLCQLKRWFFRLVVPSMCTTAFSHSLHNAAFLPFFVVLEAKNFHTATVFSEGVTIAKVLPQSVLHCSSPTALSHFSDHVWWCHHY